MRVIHLGRIHGVNGSLNQIRICCWSSCGSRLVEPVLRKPIRSCHMSPNSRFQHVGNDYTEESDGDSSGIKQMESEKPGVLNSHGRDNLLRNGNATLGDADVVEPFSDDAKCCSDLTALNFKEYKALEIFESGELGEADYRNPLVIEMCRIIERRSQWTPKLEGEMEDLLASLQPRQVCAVLRLQPDARVASQIFLWADGQDWYKHDTVVYYAMLEILSRGPLHVSAMSILRSMEKRGIELHPDAFRYVMVSYSKAHQWSSAVDLLQVMQKWRIEVDLSTCNTVINILVLACELDKAFKFLDKMKLFGIAPDVITYNCLIKGHCLANQVEKALDLITEMPLRDCPPNIVSYRTVMGFLCKENRIKELRELMDKMLRDSHLLPDQGTFRFLVHAFAKCCHGDEALEFMKEAEGKGFQIDMAGYCAVVRDLCQRGKLKQAVTVLNEMFLKGIIPNVGTYSIVVNAFCKLGKVDKAKTVFQKMRKHGCVPNTVTYSTLITGLCKNGKSSEAWEMLAMSKQDCWIPDSVTYRILMAGFCREGKLSEARDVLRAMLERGFEPKSAEINLLIQLFCRVGRIKEAKNFLETCLKKGFCVNVKDFTAVINKCCKEGDFDAAFSLLDDMYLNDIHPNVYTYTSMIVALAMKGQIDEATKLTLKMLDKGVKPSDVTYKGIIDNYCQFGGVEELLRLLKEMLLRQGYPRAYNPVVEKLCHLGKHEEASKLIGEVLGTGSSENISTCHLLLKMHLCKGSTLSAYTVACRMLEQNMIPDRNLREEVCIGLKSEGKFDEVNRLMIRINGHRRTSCSL